MSVRKKRIVLEKLEELLKKNERRIQKIAENSYHIRLQIEAIHALEKKIEPVIETPISEEAAVVLNAQLDAQEKTDAVS